MGQGFFFPDSLKQLDIWQSVTIGAHSTVNNGESQWSLNPCDSDVGHNWHNCACYMKTSSYAREEFSTSH